MVELMVVRRGAPKQQRSVETREALLLGAARVFARMSYDRARLRDIAAESGISEGALYFHFGNKDQVASAILAAQQERMTVVLTDTMAGDGPAVEKLFRVMRGLGQLIASDEVVQAGVMLAGATSTEAAEAHEPFFEWIRIARTLIRLGVDDGSITDTTDPETAAELVNYTFVGAQVVSGLADSWASLPRRLVAVEGALRALLAPGQSS